MKKILCMIILSCSIANSFACNNSPNTGDKIDNCVVGGWYPVFFTNYNESEILGLISRKDHIKSVKIDYDIQKDLAFNIFNKLKENNIDVSIEKSKMVDTDTIQYEHNKVILTVYSK